ncbi:MAG: hypothetical protein A2418_02065 [Candidatus Brennerbacteria bacterium RIFOXYC1_FULL_41_11]|uniref:Glycosyltransferase 2-like domain-containing protein n=1 Tax=Candidatus Brennerbacteria bacterium RIFOXYD1_FULL_41_16 TaxID=1797529 RepID=A0A1G1XKR9_9BACT|nr:MAG: hypothetical protein A2391_01420 [Candidatus Brennerbacteria bacterium RIFOXYB1_FULL_41_13]OGY39934.1 MAG: hypothetical protein A2418_02065 [Candidatus Brennerbacteria bacterium RIFOXYC1_FULL_41_11]OGY40745.1 MAG: hypothetical protein A2570_01280 [Candidatus Brennerbacteria bacterium RIFOXYD1_FULL_41_16]
MKQDYYLRLARPSDLKDKKERVLFRFFEMLPGLLAWLTFIALILGSRFFPNQTSLVLIVFILFWFLRTIYFLIHLVSSYKQARENRKTSWEEELNKLSFPRKTLPELSSWKDIWHLIILPTVIEPYDILRDSLKSIAESGYPTERMIVVLAFEERGGNLGKENAKKAEREFGKIFTNFLTTFHPDNTLGELKGKGANQAYAAKQAKTEIDRMNIPYENIIVSVFDCDTRTEKSFFHCLTHNYLTCEKPLRSSFQPIPLYTNNIWHAPALAYILSFSATFWQMIQQARPEILITYSSHSMGFKPLIEVGLWQENIVSEDSRIFYQCFLTFDGDWQAIPLKFFIHMDANIAPTFWQTMKNQYKQQRRWAYGAENIPYLLFGFIKNKKIRLGKKWLHGLHIVEGFHSWCTHSLILFGLGWLPLLLGTKNFSFTVLSYNLPQIAGLFMRISMIGMLGSMYLATVLMPHENRPISAKDKIIFSLRWLLGPLTILLSTIPALEASTRLMLGKHMGFWVTPKERIKKAKDNQ